MSFHIAQKDELIAALFREGKSQRFIAKTVGVSQPMVHKYLRKLGLITKTKADNQEKQEATISASDNRIENSPAQGTITPTAKQGDPPPVPQSLEGAPPAAESQGDSPEPTLPMEEDGPLRRTDPAEDPPAFIRNAEDALRKFLDAAARSKPTSTLLGEAAEVILSTLNAPLVEFFRQRCQSMDVKPWQVLCAIVHRTCEHREIDFYPDTFGIKDVESRQAKILCRNCGQDIPSARRGQIYCCEKCSSYHQGSRVIPFGVHSEECPIKGQPWQRETRG